MDGAGYYWIGMGDRPREEETAFSSEGEPSLSESDRLILSGESAVDEGKKGKVSKRNITLSMRGPCVFVTTPLHTQ